MPDCPSPIPTWLRQLQQTNNLELLELAARQKRGITVVLTYDTDGKSRPPKITLG